MKLLLPIIFASLLFAQNAHAEKIIYLVRHAKSSHDNPDLKDFDRPLAKRGHQDAKMMAEILKRKGVNPDLIISSPARRNQQTSAYFKDALYKDYYKIELDSSIYRCNPMTLVNQITKISDKKNEVMIFGHNPAITRAANYFQIDTMFSKVPTTGIVAIKFKTDSWSRVSKIKGRLIFFEYPKRHVKK
ncbi:MAG: histidine phosphatase family protein [Crocinitomicaceae bacterium]